MRMQKKRHEYIIFLLFSLAHFKRASEWEKKRNTYQTITNRLATIILLLFFYFSSSNFLSHFFPPPCLPLSVCLSVPYSFLCTYFFDKYFMWENFDAFLKHLIDKLWRMYDARKTTKNKKRTKPFSWTWIPLAKCVRAKDRESERERVWNNDYVLLICCVAAVDVDKGIQHSSVAA